MTLSVSFPVFAAQGLRLEVSGWGGGDGDPIDMVSILHDLEDGRWIEIESEIAEDGFHLPDARRDAAARLRSSGHGPVETPSEPRPLRVDGIEVPFAFASSGDRWVAIGATGDVTITVQAEGMDDWAVELRAVVDPARLLDGGIPEYRASRQEHHVLDPRRVVELADATRLGDLGGTLAGLARGALALLVSEDPEPSWIGGDPALPAGAQWPRGHHGPMTFVAQLSLAGLDPSVWSGPASGHLHVFCDIEPESRSIEGAGACAILHTPTGVELNVRRPSSDLHEDTRIRQRFVKPRIGLTLPDEDAPPMLPLGLGFGGERQSDLDHLWKLEARLHAEQGWHHRAGQLLGWPAWQNDDGTEHLASLRNGQALEWALLLQTDAVDAELYVMLPAADLAAARFDRAEATIEHD
jgi:hypothetical protein